MDVASVGVVILSYNDVEHTLACLEKVHEQVIKPRRVILCDNGSDNDTVDIVLKRWQELALKKDLDEPMEVFCGDCCGASHVLLRKEENLGVGSALNYALSFLLRDTSCQAFWILHSDTLPESYALAAILDLLVEKETENETHKEYNPIGMVGCSLLFADRALQECAGGGVWSKFTGKGRLLGYGYDKFAPLDQKEVEKDLDYINGASCFILRNLVEKIGFFDERFYISYEDIDYGLRAKKAGFQLVWAPGAIVLHHAPHSEIYTPVLNWAERTVNDNILYFTVRNRFYMLRREKPMMLCLAFPSLFFSGLFSVFLKRQKNALSLRLKAAMDGILKKMDKK